MHLHGGFRKLCRAKSRQKKGRPERPINPPPPHTHTLSKRRLRCTIWSTRTPTHQYSDPPPASSRLWTESHDRATHSVPPDRSVVRGGIAGDFVCKNLSQHGCRQRSGVGVMTSSQCQSRHANLDMELPPMIHWIHASAAGRICGYL